MGRITDGVTNVNTICYDLPGRWTPPAAPPSTPSWEDSKGVYRRESACPPGSFNERAFHGPPFLAKQDTRGPRSINKSTRKCCHSRGSGNPVRIPGTRHNPLPARVARPTGGRSTVPRFSRSEIHMASPAPENLAPCTSSTF